MPSSSSHGAAGGKLSRKRRPLLLLLASLLLVAVVAGVAAGAVRSRRGRQMAAAHGVLRASCSSTLYPDLCYSSFAGQPSLLAAVTDQRDVVHGAITLSKSAVHHIFSTVQKIRASRGGELTERERSALHDCLEMFEETLEELGEADADLSSYDHGASSRVLARHAADLKTLLSAAITNQDTCLDGFSHDKADRRLRDEIRAAVTHVSHLCSNALAMVTNMTDGDISARLEVEQLAASSGGHRKLLEAAQEEAVYGVDEEGFPTWMSAADRRLLQQSTVTPNVVVAADGSGDFKTVSAAVAAAPSGSSKRYIIRIKAGTYRENVDVPKSKTNIMFVGDGRGSTVITGSRNVVDGSTTFNSATVGKRRPPPHLRFERK